MAWTDPTEQGKERKIAGAIAASGHAYGRDDDQDEFDAIETSTAESISQIAEEQLAAHRAEQSEEVDDESWPFLVWEVDKGNGSVDDIARKEVVSWGQLLISRCFARLVRLDLDLRVGQEARGSNAPDPEVPRVEVQLISQLTAVLAITCRESRAVVAQKAAILALDIVRVGWPRHARLAERERRGSS